MNLNAAVSLLGDGHVWLTEGLRWTVQSSASFITDDTRGNEGLQWSGQRQMLLFGHGLLGTGRRCSPTHAAPLGNACAQRNRAECRTSLTLELCCEGL